MKKKILALGVAVLVLFSFVLVIKNGESYQETWRLGDCGYTDPITNEHSALPAGTHELKFRAIITIDQNEIDVFSNTIQLIVT